MTTQAIVREVNFDCLVGPTHFFGGLSWGNLASAQNKSRLSSPKRAALQGLQKMRYLAARGFAQALLPPHDRPHMKTLHTLGFYGSPEKMLTDARQQMPDLFASFCSSSAMWAANAATVCPRSDAQDHKTHLTPANLITMFHRSIESEFTTKVLRTIFHDQRFFKVHDPLPAHDLFSDEGAANHNRLCPSHSWAGLQLFIHGKTSSILKQATKVYPARQSLLASQAIARNHALSADQVLHFAQNPSAIDAGAFHNDVVSVANESVFLCHEFALQDQSQALKLIEERYKISYNNKPNIIVLSNSLLPIKDAVSSYLFNSQLLSKADGRMLLFAPTESQTNASAQTAIESLIADDNPIDEVSYFDISESMANGGGPACLRLRVPLNEEEFSAIPPQVIFSEALFHQLSAIITTYYLDDLSIEHFFDKHFIGQCRQALDEISRVLGLSPLYDWQA